MRLRTVSRFPPIWGSRLFLNPPISHRHDHHHHYPPLRYHQSHHHHRHHQHHQHHHHMWPTPVCEPPIRLFICRFSSGITADLLPHFLQIKLPSNNDENAAFRYLCYVHEMNQTPLNFFGKVFFCKAEKLFCTNFDVFSKHTGGPSSKVQKK